MGMRLRIFLNPEEDRTLRELSRATTVPERVKERAMMIRMNVRGDYIETIATFFNRQKETVRNALKRWEIGGLGGLWEASGRGKARRWQEEDIVYVEQILRNDERTYTAAQLAQRLEKERQVSLSPGHLREVLKKRV